MAAVKNIEDITEAGEEALPQLEKLLMLGSMK